jgi:MipA family protein
LFALISVTISSALAKIPTRSLLRAMAHNSFILFLEILFMQKTGRLPFAYALLTTLASAPLAHAQQTPNTEHADLTLKPLWELGVGLGAARTPAYIGASETVQRVLPVPYVIYRGEIFRADQDGVGARVLRGDNWLFDLGFSAGLDGNNKELVARKGMSKLGPTFEVGPRFRWFVAKPSPGELISFNVPLRAVIEINGGLKGQGAVLEPTLRYDNDHFFRGVGLVAQAGVLVGDRRVNGHYYNVAPQFATAARPTYFAKSGLMATKVSAVLYKEVTPDLSIAVFARWDGSSSAANEASPLHTKANAFTFGLGATYSLMKSSQMVKR